MTGGEPTLRDDFQSIVEGLTYLPIEKLGVTSNGSFLQRHLPFLKTTLCQNINISLDSLNETKFNKLTKRENSFQNTLKSILQAQEMGFKVKVNNVLMKGINDNEILDFVEFSEKYGIEVRFLEVMRIGQACGIQDDLFLSAQEAIDIIKEYRDLEVQRVEWDSTSFNYTTSVGGKIGFIASETMPFCGNCSRWRLSADGFLRACLMSEKGVKLKGVPFETYPLLFAELLKMKPVERLPEVHQSMNMIGG